ncbi:MAG: ABC transporter permease [Spirochaetales bacterium]|nr:ABC transporter permease [Spirochaetales bacterium]
MINKKKLSFDTKFELMRFTVAILIAIGLSFVTILIVSHEPLLALRKLFLGPVESFRRFGNVVELAITLSFAGLAVAIMFSANQFNMGAEGAFFASAGVAAMFSLALPLPPVLAPLFAIIVGGITGAIICVIPAWIKMKWGASELVSSLMLNYVFYYLTKYFAFTKFKDPNCGFVGTFKIPEAAKLAKIVPHTRIHAGLIILVFVVIATIFFMKKTRWGYNLIQTGQNPHFAKYVGINTGIVIAYSQIVGGFVAGMGGAVEVLGMYNRFQWKELPGYGFDGIVVAIMAKNKPQYVPLAAFFLAYLRIGADKMATATDVTSEMISIIQGVIIMLVAAQAFLSHRRQKMLVKEVSKNV